MAITAPQPAAAGTEELEWGAWNTGVFARAKAENRFVLLDLGAVWCHWCHVMEETTYRDPAVVRLIRSRYLPVRVDQDANPDLSNRYEDYGWPATIVFAQDGTELAKRRGYIPPEQFAALRQAFIDDPKPGPSVVPATPVVPVAQAALDPASEKALLAEYFALYDDEHGGWGTMHKFMDADSIEYALRGALNGGARLVEIAKRTLDAATALIDPVWGGVHQYSVGPTWNDPHFEKIMSFQASYLRAYSLAFGLWQDEKYRKTAQAIFRYLTKFLMSPDGVFYVSQDRPGGERQGLLCHERRCAGFITAPVPADAVGVFKKAVRQVDENGSFARTANLLFHYTGNARHRETAGHAMRYLAAPALLESRRLLPGVLITAHELSEEPLHITVVGKRRDASARVLYAEALRWPAVYKRIEWWDRSEGPLPNPDVQYPPLDKAAIFLCTNKTCSLPMYTPEALTKRLQPSLQRTLLRCSTHRLRVFLPMVGARR